MKNLFLLSMMFLAIPVASYAECIVMHAEPAPGFRDDPDLQVIKMFKSENTFTGGYYMPVGSCRLSSGRCLAELDKCNERSTPAAFSAVCIVMHADPAPGYSDNPDLQVVKRFKPENTFTGGYYMPVAYCTLSSGGCSVELDKCTGRSIR